MGRLEEAQIGFEQVIQRFGGKLYDNFDSIIGLGYEYELERLNAIYNFGINSKCNKSDFL
jgi:hypothetical protein